MARPDLDPIGTAVANALRRGWRLIPQAGVGHLENALVRTVNGVTDLVTLPVIGDSTVVRIVGGPALPARPRATGRQVWRWQVPVTVAVQWALDDADDDKRLRRWSRTAVDPR